MFWKYKKNVNKICALLLLTLEMNACASCLHLKCNVSAAAEWSEEEERWFLKEELQLEAMDFLGNTQRGHWPDAPPIDQPNQTSQSEPEDLLEACFSWAAKGTVIKHQRVCESPVCVCVSVCTCVCIAMRFIATGGVISWKRFNRPWLTMQPANKDKMFLWSCFVLRHAAREAGKVG